MLINTQKTNMIQLQKCQKWWRKYQKYHQISPKKPLNITINANGLGGKYENYTKMYQINPNLS